MKYKNIAQIVKDKLCTRCGSCVAVCPHNAITLNNIYFPEINDNCIDCSLCVHSCPGWDTNYSDFTSRPPQNKHLEGNYNDVYLCAATDDKIKHNASGGGIVTGLLTYLFDKELINGAVVTRGNPDKPWQSETILATSRDEIISCSQSRYTITPVNTALKEIEKHAGKFALVALPCQIQGFKKMAKLNKIFDEKTALTIGLYCHLNLELEATTALIINNKINFSDISKIEYRGGSWPGRIRAILKDGTIRNLHAFDIKDGALNYLKRFYTASRCLLCIDAAAELADISIADAWIRDKKGNWLMEDKGRWSIILERTSRGKKIISQAINDGALTKNDMAPDLILSAHDAMIREKKRGAAIRIQRLMDKKLPYPDYHLPLYHPTKRDIWKEKLYQCTLMTGKCFIIRGLLMKFCFSKAGNVFTWLKLSWKKWARRSK